MELYKITYYLECIQEEILNPEESSLNHIYSTKTLLKTFSEVAYGKNPVDAIKKWEKTHKKKKEKVQLQEITKYEVKSSEN